MTAPIFRRFLAESIVHDPAREEGLRDDEIYGVYLSWCFLNDHEPVSDRAFWAAMRGQGFIRPRGAVGRYVCAGVGMTGPAAVDYILSSHPSLV